MFTIIVVVVIVVVCIVSAANRSTYSDETNRMNKAFNLYIDDYLENGLRSREPYTRTWQEFLDKE